MGRLGIGSAMRTRDSARGGSRDGTAGRPHAAEPDRSPLGLLQRMADRSAPVQRLAVIQAKGAAAEERKDGGLPSGLRAGVESLSGMDVSDVRVHYNSSRPAALQAHAFAQGSDIHVAAGQERHLPHEAWHVVQQRQGRVRPTTSVAGTAVNDDPGLEAEADRMGARALSAQPAPGAGQREEIAGAPAQRAVAQLGRGRQGGGQRRGGQPSGATLSDTQRAHILVGDHNGGGHQFGAGKGKSEFPESWKARDIINAVKNVANNGEIVRRDDNGRLIVQKTVNGVNVRVVVTSRGDIITGYPI